LPEINGPDTFSSPKLACMTTESFASRRASTGLNQISLLQADERDRESIYAIRHEVYARELGQHGVNGSGRLRDSLDEWNVYLVAKTGAEIAGFISITPRRVLSWAICPRRGPMPRR
jgi:hypothetical protein